MTPATVRQEDPSAGFSTPTERTKPVAGEGDSPNALSSLAEIYPACTVVIYHGDKRYEFASAAEALKSGFHLPGGDR
jgi:hypothetical protein